MIDKTQSLVKLSLLLAALAVPVAAAPQALAAPTVQQSGAQNLNYRDADIRVFIEDISLETRKTFIIDPAVSGKVNLVSSVPLAGDQLFMTFLSVLQVNGLAAVPTSTGAYKIIKDSDALTAGAAKGQNTADMKASDMLVTRVFTVAHIDPTAVRDTLRPYINSAGHIYARPEMPLVIISDRASNMAVLKGIIDKIDIDKSVIRTLRLRHTSASEMADVAKSIAAVSGSEDNRVKRLSAIAVQGSNSLLLKGLPEVLDKYQALLSEIDANNAFRGDVKVVHLKYANAQKMLPMLQSVASAITQKGGAAGSNDQVNGVTISAFDGANAIIITAAADMQARITQVIKELDIARPQVQVEAIIVEVSENASKDLGLQYILAGGDGSSIPFTVQNYANSAPNLLAATGAMVVNDGGTGDGSSSSASSILQAAAVDSFLGLNGFGIGAAGRTSNGGVFGVILNALATDSDSNILSTPSITTLDNEAAAFMAGQEIPVTTGETLGSANLNPFRTIERKNVGIRLSVVPQINDDGEIQMVITQEVSALAGTTASGEIITNKREMSATVRVPDGEILVLGGLIQENERISVDKVPFLGDIPLIGNAFRSSSKVKEKTNLMVFLRPTILKNSADIKQAADRKFNLMRERQKASGSTLNLDAMMDEITGKSGKSGKSATKKEAR